MFYLTVNFTLLYVKHTKIHKLKKLYPNLQEESDVVKPKYEITNENATYEELLENIERKQNIMDKKEKDLVGTYMTQEWNGQEGIIVLYRDKTCIHPSGYMGTWYIENGKLYMDVNFPTIASNKEKTSYYETFEKTEKKKIEVLVVEKGLMFSSKFFEKI